MANITSFVTEYTKNLVDTLFAKESLTALLETGEKYFKPDFNEAGYVKLMSILTDGLSDYYRVNHVGVAGSASYAHDNQNNGSGYRDGYDRGSVTTSWEIFKLEYNRAIQFPIDDADNYETANLIIANTLPEFIRTKVIPEVDAVRFSKISAKCNAGLGNLVSGVIAPNTIISELNYAFQWLSENEVPDEDQVIFVSPAVMTSIRATNELVKPLLQADFKSERGVDFSLESYMGRPIVVVPATRFYTKVVTGQYGYGPSSTSKLIDFMVCSKKACIPVVRTEKSKVFGPDVVQDFDGYKLNFHIYHDIFIPKNKVVGCYTHVSTSNATEKANKLLVALSAGFTTNAVKFDAVYTNPAGIRGDVLVYQSSSSAITTGLKKVGDAIVIDETTILSVAVDGDNNYEQLSFTTDNHVQFVLVRNGVAVAVTGDIDVSGIKKA